MRDGRIESVLPRRTKLSRKAAGKRTVEQVVAANVDTVLIVMGLDADYSERRLERYLTTVWESGARPAVLLNKIDLDPEFESRRADIEEIAAGVPVVAASCLGGEGLDAVRALLRPRETAVLVGSSGVADDAKAVTVDPDGLIYSAGIELGAVDATFNNSVYECGAADPLVVCATEVLPFPEGDLLIVAVEHDGRIPTDSDARSYIYSLVFESDGDPANDWVYNEPFDWDYFQGADRWYQAIYSHASGDWLVDVTQVAAGNQTTSVPSAVRAVVDGRWIFWFIPADEIPDFPGRLRATAFVHDGFFGEATRAGDVTGADPTEPLFNVEAAPVG